MFAAMVVLNCHCPDSTSLGKHPIRIIVPNSGWILQPSKLQGRRGCPRNSEERNSTSLQTTTLLDERYLRDLLCWGHSGHEGQTLPSIHNSFFSMHKPYRPPECVNDPWVWQMSRPEKGVITKGVFSLAESLESLQSVDSLESLENGRILLCFPQSGGSLETLESLHSLESLENGLFWKDPFFRTRKWTENMSCPWGNHWASRLNHLMRKISQILSREFGWPTSHHVMLKVLVLTFDHPPPVHPHSQWLTSIIRKIWKNRYRHRWVSHN